MQLEDGSTAYIQHTVHMPQSNTILAIQADGTIADLQAEATAIDPETISVLEQYTKVNMLHHCTSVALVCHTELSSHNVLISLCRFFKFYLLFWNDLHVLYSLWKVYRLYLYLLIVQIKTFFQMWMDYISVCFFFPYISLDVNVNISDSVYCNKHCPFVVSVRWRTLRTL